MQGEDDRRIVKLALFTILLVAPALAGCLGDEELLVALSAPAEADGLTIFAVHRGGIGDRPSEQMTYDIRYAGRIVYPPGGVGGALILDNGRGSVHLPYSFFVEGNGFYEVRARLGDAEADARAAVDKWVEYVYLHPYWKNGKPLIDLQLSKTTGGHPADRVIARGTLVLEVRYRGLDGSLNAYSGYIRETTPADETFTRIEIPRSVLDKGPGWYSFDATFDNHQANGNNRVGNDPTMAERNPPWNWLYVKP